MMAPPRQMGERLEPERARPVPFCFQGLTPPPETSARVIQHPEGLHRVVCDYVAGMTDRYAIQEYRRLYDMEERA